MWVCKACFFVSVSVAIPEDRAQVVGYSGPTAMGVQPAHEHFGPVRAPTGSLGGGENGSLPPNLRAGNISFIIYIFLFSEDSQSKSTGVISISQLSNPFISFRV